MFTFVDRLASWTVSMNKLGCAITHLGQIITKKLNQTDYLVKLIAL